MAVLAVLSWIVLVALLVFAGQGIEAAVVLWAGSQGSA